MIEPDLTTPPDLTSPTPFDTLPYRVRNVPIFTTVSHNDPWDHALSQYSASIGTLQNKRNLNLSTLVMHGNEAYSRIEWSWNDSLHMARLQAIPGQTIQISCRITNGSTYHRPTEIKTVYTDSSSPENYKAECYKITEPNSDCRYNLTFTKPIIVYCLWGYRGTELLFEFIIDTASSALVAKDKEPLPPQISENVSTRPPISLTPFIFNTGPYIIKNTALGANQWLLLDILPQWGEVNEKDHKLIVDALGVTQNNVSLALSYNITVDTSNRSNICVCNFTKIMGCDFNYSSPVTTPQLLQANCTLYQALLPAPIGMNLTLVRKLLQHDDLNQLLRHVRNNGQRTLITIHHGAEEIHHVLERVKKDENTIGGKLFWDGHRPQQEFSIRCFNQLLFC
ncbi:hypothetical protein QYF61_011204 [Mycteria americana]|uniref:Uncharacterized protein n=1 Tax=Mycteria americana TaxID=33587 RepID=A0AAN7S6P1_MYCAM|nr:hypothetical protein QYF61_011204 [Mycteria americana]